MRLRELVLQLPLEEKSLALLVLKALLVLTMCCVQETIMLSIFKKEKRSEVCFVQLVTAYQPSFLSTPPTSNT